MAVATTVRRIEAGQTIAAISSALVAGLMVGTSECLFFVYALNRSAIELSLKYTTGTMVAMDVIDAVAIGLFALAPIGAGLAFAYLARGGTLGWRRTLTAGVCLLAASMLGMSVALIVEGSASRLGVLLAFRIGFTLASGTAALLCTWGVAWLLRVDGAFRKAVLVGAVTAIVYLLYALLIDPLPGFHVGGGNMGMPRVAMVGNFLAGALGGALAFPLLSEGARRP
jgi:hypothetical protein